MIRHLQSCVQNRVGYLYAHGIPALQGYSRLGSDSAEYGACFEDEL